MHWVCERHIISAELAALVSVIQIAAEMLLHWRSEAATQIFRKGGLHAELIIK